ncbi:hypothetical protein ASG87_15750 [Frateuria sp. Soil773]|nr:hypothetical protein ASG87_15750 [Frateuria sp. Soil773]
MTLRAEHAEDGKFGASVTMLDAAPYRGRSVKLSAELATRDAAKGATIWLRADGASGGLAFASSDAMPVRGTTPATHREVRIDVPAAATRLLLGTTLRGPGEVAATRLRLEPGGGAPVAVTPQDVLDAAIGAVRKRALHAQDVDWNSVEPRIRAMAKGAKQTTDVYPAIRALLAALGDHHSLFMEPGPSHRYEHQGRTSAPPVVALKPGGIGYIGMPGYSGTDPAASRAFVGTMVEAIGRIAPQVSHGWIVDLRQDSGGNMRPMLAGLRPLLGGRPVGAFRGSSGRLSPFGATDPMDDGLPTGPDLQHAPVAVLTGPRTASSGEVVAVAFRGRPATRSFGQPTAGLSTGNAPVALPDGSTIFLTEAVDVDRNGRAYGGKLAPDEAVAETGDAGRDAPLAAAMAWLARQPARSR